MSVSATVQNQGSASAGGFYVSLNNGTSTQTNYVSGLAADASKTLMWTFTASVLTATANRSLTVFADSTYAIIESNENNNTRNGSFTVSNPLPDLTVTRIQASKNEYEEDETGTVTVTVKNQGALAVGNSKLKLTLGGFFSEVKQTGAIPVGGSVQITFAFTAPETLERLTVTATATADPTDEIPESNESNNTMISTLAVKPILPDLGIVNTNATNWYAGKDIVVTATVANYTKRDVPSVTVRLTIGGRRYEEAIPLPGNGTNLAVFRLTLPTTTGATALSFVVDPYNEIPERNDDNNDLDKTIEIVSVPVGVVLDPDLAALETNYKSSGLAPLPDTTNSDYHIWQEVRLEGEAYVTKTYWAQLRTVFTVSPDPRIAYEDKPTQMESGFGIEAYLQTILTTNYDHPKKLVGVQMAWVFSPESGYGQVDGMSGVFDALEPRIWSPDANSMLWEYAVNPWSETNSRLRRVSKANLKAVEKNTVFRLPKHRALPGRTVRNHYTPLWFPGGQYTVLSQALYAWSPAGQLYWYDAGNVDILGDMYDRVTAIQGR